MSAPFDLAYGLNLAGVFFEGSWMLAALGQDPTLQADCAEHQAQLDASAAVTRRHIRAVHSALQAAGLAVPEPPAHTAAYLTWTESVSESYWAELSEEQAAAYLLGWHLGSWVQSANLVVIVLALKQAHPQATGFDEHLSSLADALRTAALGFAELDTSAPPLAKLVATIGRIPVATGSSQEPLDLADDYQEALHDLGEALDAVRASYGAA